MSGPASLLALVEQYVRTQVVGREAALDVPTEPPLQPHESFHTLGVSNWWLPADVGGRAVPLEESVDLVSALSYGDMGVAFTALISILGTTMVDLFGSPEQRQRYLAPLPGKPRYAALAASERQAGSELLRMDAAARRDGSAWVLDGPKFFCSNAAFAEFVVVVARVPGKPRDDYKAFVVEKGNPGLKLKQRWRTTGMRSAATWELELSDCRVEEGGVLGGHGLRGLEVALNASRTLIAAMGIGVAERARDLCLQYAEKKSVHGQTLLANAAFQGKLGQMEMEIEAIRCACRAAGAEFDRGYRQDRQRLLRTGVLKSSLVAKMLSGQLAWKVCSAASESFGGLGYTEDSLIGKLMRDVRIISLGEGGDELLRETLFTRWVARRLEELTGEGPDGAG